MDPNLGMWWAQPFIFWWCFMIKYFIPWILFSLMMWNFSKDITPDDDGRLYGGYHAFW